MHRPIWWPIVLAGALAGILDRNTGDLAAALQGRFPHPWHTIFILVVIVVGGWTLAALVRKAWIWPKESDTSF